MLMALLPFVAWGSVVRVTPFNVSKYYGQSDANITLIYDVETPTDWDAATSLSDDVKAAILRAGLQISRNGANAGEAVGDYTYTLQFKKSLALAAAGSDFTTDDVNEFTAAHSIGVNGSSVLSIEKMSLSEADIVVATIPAQVYTGSPITPALTVTNNGVALVLNDDYTVEWANNTDAGTANVTLTGMGSYEGTKSTTFQINAGLSDATITLANYPTGGFTYSASAQTPNVTVKVGNETLTADTHYTVSYFNNATETAADVTNAGTIKIIVTGVDANGYSGTNETATYVINPKAVEAADIDVTLNSTNPTYTGSAVKPDITAVTAATFTVTTDDYDVATTSVNAGAATATLTLKRNFTGSKTVDYTIAQKNLTSVTGSLSQTAATTEENKYYWSNGDIKPAVTLLDGTTTVAASNFTVVYYNWDGTSTSAYSKAVGKKRAVVSAKADGNYTFTAVNLDYEIVKKPLTITVNDLNVGYGVAIAPTLAYDGLVDGTSTSSKINPDVMYTYKDASSNTVTDIAAAAPGTYTIEVSNTSTLQDKGNGANYDFTWVNGTLVKTASQVVVKIADQTIEYGDAFPTSGWTVSHVSGLAENTTQAEVDALVGISSIQGNFKLATAVDGVLDVDATGYDVMYKDGTNPDNVIVNANYTITVQPGKLIVGKKKITAGMITIDDAKLKYTGAAVHPTVTISQTLNKADGSVFDASYTVPNSYYITDYDESFNAGTRTAQISVGAENAYYVTETPVNFDATTAAAYNTEHGLAAGDEGYKNAGDLKEVLPYVEKTYTIQPLAVKITADNFTGAKAWTYGSGEPTYTAKAADNVSKSGDASVEAAKITALLAGEQPEGFNGTLKIKRVGADGVGTWTGALKPVIVDADGNELAAAYNGTNPAADNYTFTFVNGNLEIKKGTIKVKVKDAELVYGETPAAFYLEATSGMENETAEFDNIVTYSTTPADYGWNATEFKAIGNYTLTYAGAAPTATNYDIEFDTDDTGALTVSARPIKLKAKDASKTLTDAATFSVTVASDVEVVSETGFYGFTDGDSYATLIKSIAIESKNLGANNIVLTGKTVAESAHVANYAITLVPGTLTVTSDASVTDITLNRVDKADVEKPHLNTAARLIEQNADQYRNVLFSDFNMIAEKWYPLVLPFATSVKDISAAFGYAVVDIFNGTDADGNIQFKLHMGDIEANTPFIVKVYKQQNMSDATVKFQNVRIVNAMDDNKEVKVGEATGVQFVGSYAGKTDGFRSNMYYFSASADYNEYYKGNDTNATYLRPLGAYFLDNSADAASANRMIIIEEPNGNTTKISAITAEGASIEADGWYTVSGVKLEGAPTEKGVYIRNGKKVVLK